MASHAPAQVRMLAPDHFRIYLRGEDAPGLTMGRCFGDFVLSPAIVDTPEYKKLEMSDGSPWWAVVASDGVWEFMTPDAVHKGMAKKMRLKGPVETNRAIMSAALKRWQQYENDYCDDITSICIQFNQQAKGSTTLERQLNFSHVFDVVEGEYGGHYYKDFDWDAVDPHHITSTET